MKAITLLLLISLTFTLNLRENIFGQKKIELEKEVKEMENNEIEDEKPARPPKMEKEEEEKKRPPLEMEEEEDKKGCQDHQKWKKMKSQEDKER